MKARGKIVTLAQNETVNLSHIINIIYRALTDLRGVLLPRYCPVCSQAKESWEDIMCTNCLINLPRYGIEDSDDNSMLRRIWASLPVEHASTWLVYNRHSPYTNLIRGFKYNHRHDLAKKLGEMACDEVGNNLKDWHVDVIVPVPLHPRKQKERGYNQSEVLAESLSRLLQVPVVDLLERTKYRKPQARMNLGHRERNAEGIYTASVPDEWRGKHILLVDDIMTTGYTIMNCAKVILDSDPRAIISIFTLACTPQNAKM